MQLQRNLLVVGLMGMALLLGLSIIQNGKVAEAFSTQPAFLLHQDKSTGLMEVTQSVVSPSLEILESDLYIESKIMQYVVRRERYYAHTFELDQEYIRAHSDEKTYKGYQNIISPDNPKSLTNNLKDDGFAHAIVKNIIKLRPSEYQIRWELQVFNRLGAKPRTVPVTTILKLGEYTKDSIPSKRQDRLLNPFGTRIINHMNQRETV